MDIMRFMEQASQISDGYSLLAEIGYLKEDELRITLALLLQHEFRGEEISQEAYDKLAKDHELLLKDIRESPGFFW